MRKRVKLELFTEFLQCVGLSKFDLLSNTDAICYIVYGSHVSCTGVIDDKNGPIWPQKSRKECIIPINHSYAQFFVGAFDDDGENKDN